MPVAYHVKWGKMCAWLAIDLLIRNAVQGFQHNMNPENGFLNVYVAKVAG